MSKKYRQIQLTDKKGNKRILSHEEARKVAERLITSDMMRDAFIAGIPIIEDGISYELLKSEREKEETEKFMSQELFNK